jgi:16S rRNA (guanine(966)-N(2))-methyltransferase RsmD
MRIIAGHRKGRKLATKYDATTRPTTDRVRENVFNVLFGLVEIQGARVLDLFAGCGAYGLECYSRGAKEVIFNDVDKKAVEVIKKNCKSVGCESLVLNLDFKNALEKLGGKQFDIIFLDPPYESDFAVKSVEIIMKQNMLSDTGIIVIESEKELNIPSLKTKIYGRVRLYFVNPNLQLR